MDIVLYTILMIWTYSIVWSADMFFNHPDSLYSVGSGLVLWDGSVKGTREEAGSILPLIYKESKLEEMIAIIISSNF